MNSLKGHAAVRVKSWAHDESRELERDIATETPVALVYNDVSYTVMMATPTELEDFALGFTLSEGLIDAPSELAGVTVEPEANGLVLKMKIPDARMERLARRERSITGKTGCSLCGIKYLNEALRPLPPVQDGLHLPFSAIYRAFDELHDRQPEKKATGALHAAAFAVPDGRILLVREDVGRHNALDKLIGAALKSGINPASGFVLITSRCSFEMVQKTVAFGAPLLAAISAPTTLAVELAAQANLTLVALARKEQFMAFTHPERIA